MGGSLRSKERISQRDRHGWVGLKAFQAPQVLATGACHRANRPNTFVVCRHHDDNRREANLQTPNKAELRPSMRCGKVPGWYLHWHNRYPASDIPTRHVVATTGVPSAPPKQHGNASLQPATIRACKSTCMTAFFSPTTIVTKMLHCTDRHPETAARKTRYLRPMLARPRKSA